MDGDEGFDFMSNFEETKTQRGFQLIKFKDRYEALCSLQQSSVADFEPPGSSAIWLGLDRLVPEQDPRDGHITRMHLSLEDVKILNAYLTKWIETGKFYES